MHFHPKQNAQQRTYSNTVLCFYLKQHNVALVVCLWSSRWKVKLCPSIRYFAASNTFSSRVVLYLALSIFSSALTSFHVPPYSMILPPPLCNHRDGVFSVMHSVRFSPHIAFC
ncbi:hypothetical protein XENOCAPTIV_021622 [Xenoophorus captivus]|uniref:Uncharacterized protein n=1 Tax=Xenoophorus captivus TaxID=1517983 RepID=A0ABV0SDH1_9TELE